MYLFSFNILLSYLVTIAVIAIIIGFVWKDKGMGCSHCSALGWETEGCVGVGGKGQESCGQNPGDMYGSLSATARRCQRLCPNGTPCLHGSSFSFVSAIKSLRRFKNHWGVIHKIQPQATDGIHAQVRPRSGQSPPLQGV